jgi:periplasmic mercuric ion binding protein
MKKIMILACAVLLLWSCEKEETRVLSLGNGDMLLELNTPTAGCENCQKVMESGLSKVAGVNGSILNLNTKNVSIVYSPEITDTIQLKNTVAQLVKDFPCK